MLGTLDPHSSFFDPAEYAQMRERQEGRYYGIGITISVDRRRHHRDAACSKDRRPTRRASAAATSSRRSAARTRRAGPPSRRCRSCAARRARRSRSTSGAAATTQLIPLELTRDEVYIPTVPAYFMIDATTGYIRMQDFGENTDRDVKHALHDLASKGMKRLLFDIRGNPGGPLDQAIKVVERVPAASGKMIVYTRGRVPNSDQDYRATEDSEFTDMPIVVIANRNSASASEIVTGALQDHDRAYIVGETTFGKALVQSVYRISGGAGLALTTAHYYTPSGRLIQRPWDATLRRVSELHAARSGRQQAAQPERPEAHRRRAARSTAAAASSPTSASPARSKASTRTRSAACCTRVRSSRTTRRSSRPKATRAIAQHVDRPQDRQAELRRRRRDGGRLPRAAEDRQGQDRRRRRSRRISSSSRR